MQAITIFQGDHLFKDGEQPDLFEVLHGRGSSAHISLETGKADGGTEVYKRFSGAQPHQAIGIGEPAKKRGNRAGTGELAHADDGPQPYKPDWIARQFVEHIVSYPRLHV